MQNGLQFRFKKKYLGNLALISNLIGHFVIGIVFLLAYVLLTDDSENICSKGKKESIIHHNEISTYSSVEIPAE